MSRRVVSSRVFSWCLVFGFFFFLAWTVSSILAASASGTSRHDSLHGEPPLEVDVPDTATIIVEAATYPRGSGVSFEFSGDVAGTAYGDGDTLWQGGLTAPGTYQSTETQPFGWHVHSIRCDDSDSYGSGSTATFNVDVDETVRCRFYNLQDGTAPCRETAGRWPFGPSYAVAVEGDTAYIGSGATLEVLNVSDPSSPQLRGTAFLSNPVRGIAVNGGYAYVTIGVGYDGTLVVVDVGDPTAPVEVGTTGSAGEMRGMDLYGGSLFVARNLWLTSYDIDDPAVPVEADSLYLGGSGYDVAVAGGIAVVAAGSAGIFVVDVSTPTDLVLLGQFNTSGGAEGVSLSGTHVYVADGTEGLRIIDISVPGSPVETGFLDTSYTSRSVVVDGIYAYVADDFGGIWIINVSDPAAPFDVGRGPLTGDGIDIVVVGDEAFLATDNWIHDGGLEIVSVQQPNDPVVVGQYLTPRTGIDMDESGGFAYLALGYEGALLVLDVEDPTAVEEVGRYINWSSILSPEAVCVRGDLAYVGGYHLEILDVGDPSNPVNVGSLAGAISDIVVDGDFAYVAGSLSKTSGLRIIDVSTPSTPVDDARRGGVGRFVQLVHQGYRGQERIRLSR